MRPLFSFGLIGLAAMLASCSVLKSPYCVGEKMDIPKDDIAVESVWKVGDEVYRVRMVDSNTVVATRLEWNDEQGAFKPATLNIAITELDEHLFFNIKDDDNLYDIYRGTISGDHSDFAIFYPVNAEEIKKHTESGRVETRDDDEFLLKGTKEEIDRFIREHINTLFDFDHIVVAKRIDGKH